MNMNYYKLTFLSICFLSISLIGNSQNSEVRYFPIKFVLVGNTLNQNNREITEEDIQAILNYSNEKLCPANIKLGIQGIQRIRTAQLTSLTKSISEDFAIEYYRDNYNYEVQSHEGMNFIHVFIFDRDYEPSGEIDAFANLPSITAQLGRLPDDSVHFTENSSVFFGQKTFDTHGGALFLHEMGHFFGLFHPFQGLRYDSDATKAMTCSDINEVIVPLNTNYAGDHLNDTKVIPRIDWLILSRDYMEDMTSQLYQCRTIWEWRIDEKQWFNIMQYNFDIDGKNYFTDDQIHRMNVSKEFDDRHILSHPEEIEIQSKEATISTNAVSIIYNIFNREGCTKSKVKNKSFSGVYRLQITKNNSKEFNYSTGFHDVWQYGANADVVVDINILSSNGIVDFDWTEDNLGLEISEGPIIGQVYKAVLARELPDWRSTGFYSISDEIEFTFQEQIIEPTPCPRSQNNATYSVTNNSAYLDWETQSEENILHWGIGSNMTNSIDRGRYSYYQLTNLQSNTNYCWYIENICGNAESNNSNEICFNTKAPPVNGSNNDFSVSTNTLNSPIRAGENIQIRTELILTRNAGGQCCMSTKVSYYLSTSPDVNDIFDFLGKSNNVAVGIQGSSNRASTIFTSEFRINEFLESDNYSVIAIVDEENDDLEFNENNNLDASGFSLLPPEIVGCNNQNAHNYNSDVVIDNGTCLTCHDGIQNGDELGIDCGGARCQPCLNQCEVVDISVDPKSREAEVSLSNADDNFLFTIYWKKDTDDLYRSVTSQNVSSILRDLEPSTNYNLFVEYFCDVSFSTSNNIDFATLPDVPGCTLEWSHNFDPMATANDDSCLTCFDNLKNGDETGVDCGGLLCYPCDCKIMNYTVDFNIYDDFELHVRKQASANKKVFFSDVLITAVECINLDPGLEIFNGSTFSADIEECGPDVQGCTDFNSHNYNSDATLDDGSCETCNDEVKNGDENRVDCGGTLCDPCPNTVSDIDGNTYSTIEIGTQTWMAENLRTSRYQNGDIIPLVSDKSSWAVLGSAAEKGAMCFYNNDNTLAIPYGGLYNWYAASDTRNVCPEGWHLPSDNDWTNLTSFLGVSAGGKMKEVGELNWKSPNVGATNESGFNALPIGTRITTGQFVGDATTSAIFWGSNGNNQSSARGLSRSLWYSQDNIQSSYSTANAGHAVRCIQD